MKVRESRHVSVRVVSCESLFNYTTYTDTILSEIVYHKNRVIPNYLLLLA